MDSVEIENIAGQLSVLNLTHGEEIIFEKSRYIVN